MSATGCRHGREQSTCKECVPSSRDRWRARDQRMRAWAVSEWRRYERRETDRYRGRPWYRDLPSRRPRVLAIGHRLDGSAPDALVYARDLRETHVEHCRRVDYDPIMTARLYLDKLRAASAPVGLLPG